MSIRNVLLGDTATSFDGMLQSDASAMAWTNETDVGESLARRSNSSARLLEGCVPHRKLTLLDAFKRSLPKGPVVRRPVARDDLQRAHRLIESPAQKS
jgi:hypothetical protein